MMSATAGQPPPDLRRQRPHMPASGDPAKFVLPSGVSRRCSQAGEAGHGGEETVVSGKVTLYIEFREQSPFANRAPCLVGNATRCAQSAGICRRAASRRRAIRIP